MTTPHIMDGQKLIIDDKNPMKRRPLSLVDERKRLTRG